LDIWTYAYESGYKLEGNKFHFKLERQVEILKS